MKIVTLTETEASVWKLSEGKCSRPESADIFWAPETGVAMY